MIMPNLMTSPQVQERISQLHRKLWSFGEIREWFGAELKTEKQSLLAQFRIWAEARKKPLETVLHMETEHIHRPYFEWFLQDRGLTPVRSAAASLGMSAQSLKETLDAAVNANEPLITEIEASGDYPGSNVYRAGFISNFYSRFPELARYTFTSHSSFCRRLHDEIRKVLGVEVISLTCETSAKIGDDPPEIACDLDVITQDPMGLPYQLWLDIDKPIQLKPDACSWVTYLRHENLLMPLVHVENDAHFQKSRESLKLAIAQ